MSDPATGPAAAVDWLLDAGRGAADLAAVLAGTAARLTAGGIPVDRASLHLQAVHRERLGESYFWWRTGQTHHTIHPFTTHRSVSYLRSPVRHVYETGEWLSARLDSDSRHRFDIFGELADDGFTHYVIAPAFFSDGTHNACSWATRSPEGFSEADLAGFRQVLPALRAVMEIRMVRAQAVELLRTYVGVVPGARILRGEVRRGQGERLTSVVWFCDLRDSTRLIDSLSTEDGLELLNAWFDAVAMAVYRAGGEVLRFVGDAALALFRVNGDDEATAAGQALRAARILGQVVADANARHRAQGLPEIRYGVGAHMGPVVFGNVGSLERMDFTVVGTAANIAARIQGATKALGQPVLVSDTLARHHPEAVREVGPLEVPEIGTLTLHTLAG